MNGSKIGFSIIVAGGLLAASTVVVLAQDADSEATRPAMATGTINHHYEGDEATGRIETNDPRLNGDISTVGSFESFTDATVPEGVDLPPDRASHFQAGGAELSWGTLEVSNGDGSWSGDMVCAPTLLTNGADDPCIIELIGAGGYDGLVALLVQGDRISAVGYEPRDETYVLDGLVFPGPLPPNR